MIASSDRLQFHYFFRDTTHSIDAILRNECEKEILSIFEEISKTLDLDIQLETMPPLEGGFIETWKFLGKNSGQISLIISIATMILSRFPAENKKLTDLQIENLRLDNDIKRKELEKLNLDFIQDEKDIDEKKLKDSLELVKKNYKVSWSKSNLYKKLDKYPKVESIEIQRAKDESPIGKPRKVPKNKFSEFILLSDDLPPKELDKAVIDIIAPAVKKGNFRWKGFYKKEIINFVMDDVNFKNHVMQGNEVFSNYYSIEVEMKQDQRIDSDGSVKTTKTTVKKVFATIENGKREEFNV